MKSLGSALSLAAIALGVLVGALPAEPARAARSGVEHDRAPELARARLLARSDIWLSRLLTGKGGADAVHRNDELAAAFSSNARAPIAIRTGRLGSVVATLEVENAPAVPLDWVDGRALYAHAPGVTGIWARLGDVLEQLLLVEQRGLDVLRWRLELREDVREVAVEPSGALLFARSNGDGVLRLPPPYAVDASGARLRVPFTWDAVRRGERLVVGIELDLRLPGATLPLLVDPAIEAVIWQEISGPSPAPRSRYGMAFDETLQKLVLFGGSLPDGADDTWTYDGTWQALPTTAAPPARYEHAMAYATNPPGVMVFGGRSSATLLGDTWRLGGSGWTQVASTGPAAREGAQLTYAPKIGAKLERVVLFGGVATSPFADTWEWSAGAWSPSAATLGSRAFHAMTYDSLNQKVLLFSGSVGAAGFFNDLWSYDGAAWTKQGDGPMAARRAPAIGFDTHRSVAVAFGGETTIDLFNDTWEWDAALNLWTERVTLTVPTKRSGMSLVYDPKRKRMVLFGGLSLSGDPWGDTWEYLAISGTCSSAAECNGVPCVDGACCVTSSCGTCSACSPTTGSCAPVLGADDPDTCSGGNTCDAAGSCKKKPGETCNQAGECASGFCADGVCCDAPCQGACEACDLAASAGTCTLVQGTARHGSCSGAAPCGSTCTGSSPSCTFAPDGTPCGAVCEGAQLQASSCNGSGVCLAEDPAPCANNFACADGAACRASCNDDGDCQTGFVCRGSACVVPGYSCADNLTALDEQGVIRDCRPYVCASGACLAECTSASQCAPGFVCNAGGDCVDVDDLSSEDDGGCGCRSSGSPSHAAGWLLAAALVTAFRRRRAAATART